MRPAALQLPAPSSLGIWETQCLQGPRRWRQRENQPGVRETTLHHLFIHTQKDTSWTFQFRLSYQFFLGFWAHRLHDGLHCDGIFSCVLWTMTFYICLGDTQEFSSLSQSNELFLNDRENTWLLPSLFPPLLGRAITWEKHLSIRRVVRWSINGVGQLWVQKTSWVERIQTSVPLCPIGARSDWQLHFASV